MGDDGRMVLDEMVYDPESQEGSLSLMAFKGVYTVVSGMISKTDPDAMVINTPVGSIGIRGTQIGIEFIDGENLTLMMMREADDYVGEVYLRNDAGVLVINQANQVLFSNSFSKAPVVLASVDDSTIVRMFQSALLYLPQTSPSANDYNTQEPSGGKLDGLVTDSGSPDDETTIVDDLADIAESDLTAPAPVVEAVVLEPLDTQDPDPLELDLGSTFTETPPVKTPS